MAPRLEDLPIYSKAREFTMAVYETLTRPRVRADRDLYGQVSDAADSILANMQEGFEQGSDDNFARYLTYSKGSVAEVLARLRQAELKGRIAKEELASREALGIPLEKMLGGFIRYLRASGFKDRGRFKQKGRSKRNGPAAGSANASDSGDSG
jgi:four helix bundle protein